MYRAQGHVRDYNSRAKIQTQVCITAKTVLLITGLAC